MAKKVYIGAENFPKIELPEGYTQLEYIQSSGTQCIDTEFKPNQNTRIVCKMQMTSAPTSGQFVYGCRTSSFSENFNVFYSTSTSCFRVGYGSSVVSVPLTSLTGMYLIDQNKNVCSFGGNVVTNTAQTFQTSLNLFLFATNEGGTAKYFGEVRIYSCRIYDGATLVRDFVPAEYLNGNVGLYDLVNKVFYENAGTGSFTGGPIHEESLAHEVKAISKNINAVIRTVKSGHIGVDGVARQFWGKGGNTLGELAVGQTVSMKVNGVSTEFIVVHQGLPSTSYDTSCDGTWLLMKDIYEKRKWDSTNNDYVNSDIHAYLNSTFLNLFDAEIKGAIKQAKIPYTQGTGASGSVKTGSNGLSAKVFLLSRAELDYSSHTYANVEGAPVAYFEGATNSKRVGYYNGSVDMWWFRSPNTGGTSGGTDNTNGAWLSNYNGNGDYYNVNSIAYGVRPCVILPSDATVDANGNVIPPAAPPSTVGDLNAGDSVFMNVDGVSTEFLVVNQGLPSSDYDSSCDGTWLLMKNLYENRVWDSSDTDYSASDIHSYLNNTFINLFDSGIKSAIKQVKLPYTNGTGSGGSLATGSNGISAKVFLLSYAEAGFSGSSYAYVEGTVLSYFSGAADSGRIGYLDGTATKWWLRTPYHSVYNYAWYVETLGHASSYYATVSYGIRPCIILPSDTGIDSNYNVTPPPLPTTLGELNAGDTVYMNVNGISTEFIAVNQGLPSSDYDSSCDGTWLLMKDCVTTMKWDATNNDYQNSDAHTYLNGTFLSMLDFGIQKAIKQAKIPYQNGTGSGGSLAVGANGLSTKAFLLSLYETNCTINGTNYTKEGAALDYFENLANADRVGYYNGAAVGWWLRSAVTNSTLSVYRMDTSGTAYAGTCKGTGYYIRPCIILPSTTGINESFTVTPPPVTVNTLSVGDTVKIKVNGVATEFIIVNKGRPSSAYDSSCNGVWVLMKDIYESRVWDSSNNDYANSDIHSYLNNTFVNLFDSNIKSVIKQVKIPYTRGTGSSGSLAKGTNGLSAKIFLISYYEAGFAGVDSNVNAEGMALDYFDGATNSKLVANLNGSAASWWLRSPRTNNTGYAYRIGSSGYSGNAAVTSSSGVRPAFVLPYTAVIDENNNIIG